MCTQLTIWKEQHEIPKPDDDLARTLSEVASRWLKAHPEKAKTFAEAGAAYLLKVCFQGTLEALKAGLGVPGIATHLVRLADKEPEALLNEEGDPICGCYVGDDETPEGKALTDLVLARIRPWLNEQGVCRLVIDVF